MSQEQGALPHQINLFNPDLQPKPVVFPAWQALALAATGTVLLFGSGFALKDRAAATERSNAQLTTQLQQLKQQQSDLENQLARRKPDSALVQSVEKLEEKQKNQQHTLELLRKTAHDPKTGFAETLRALARQRLEGLWLTTITLHPEQRTFTGRLNNPELLPRWLEGLAKEDSFSGSSYQTMEITPPAATSSAASPQGSPATPAPTPMPASGPYQFQLSTLGGKAGATPTSGGAQP